MPELEPVDESWSSALCVVAHPDDLEFGTAAAIARWTDQDKTVVYAMVTSGEAGIDGLNPTECKAVREAEQIESARIVGVEQVDFLGLPDGVLEYGVGLRRAICAAVRKHRPQIVITNNFRATWGGQSLNQADHIATGLATLDAVRDAGNRWIFREHIEAGLEPWGGVTQVWAAGSPEAQHAVETTATFERGVASLAAHHAYIDGLGWEHFDPEEFLESGARLAGTRLGVPKATTFEVFNMGWGRASPRSAERSGRSSSPVPRRSCQPATAPRRSAAWLGLRPASAVAR
ncbi:MAG: PIG-L family deacetylase [Propionibacteriaceae bacterium]|nr:PIG-L family deacetylase [Propionibacteriaceae bacterium]